MTFEEKTLDTEKIYDGKILNLRRDTVTVLHGQSSREIIEHNGGAVIVPILPGNRVVMVRQFRKPAEQVLMEIPAGKIDPGEDPDTTALRELREETGYRAGKLRKLVAMYPTPGYSEEVLHIYLAEDLVPGETDFDENEALDILEVPFDEIVSKIMDGEIADAKTIVGILMADKIIRSER